MQEFLRYIAQDHDIKVSVVWLDRLLKIRTICIKNDDTEGFAEKVLRAVRRGGSSNLAENLQQDMGVHVMKLLQASGKQWPTVVGPSFALPTNSFSIHNAQLLKGALPSYPAQLLLIIPSRHVSSTRRLRSKTMSYHMDSADNDSVLFTRIKYSQPRFRALSLHSCGGLCCHGKIYLF